MGQNGTSSEKPGDFGPSSEKPGNFGPTSEKPGDFGPTSVKPGDFGTSSEKSGDFGTFSEKPETSRFYGVTALKSWTKKDVLGKNLKNRETSGNFLKNGRSPELF